MVLLVIIPLIAALAGGAFYLMGGRYISTDNAYVGAQKVLITPDVSGKIIACRRSSRASTSRPAMSCSRSIRSPIAWRWRRRKPSSISRASTTTS